MAERLSVDIILPFACEPSDPDPRTLAALQLGNRHLLRVCNLIESSPMESEAERAQQRVEAKLDLLLHWLGQSLYGQGLALMERALHLDLEGLAWTESAPPPEGSRVILKLRLHPGLAGLLELPARIGTSQNGRVRAIFTDLDAELADLWNQWLFRQHRRAIQAEREKKAAD